MQNISNKFDSKSRERHNSCCQLQANKSSSPALQSIWKSSFNSTNLIPEHRFGFGKKHGTIEQIHRISKEMYSALESTKYCNAVFLEVAQAFDKVWYNGLSFKIKNSLPENTHLLFKSYLNNRKFKLKYNSFISRETDINAGLPQESVLDSFLYLIFAAKFPLDRLRLSTSFPI